MTNLHTIMQNVQFNYEWRHKTLTLTSRCFTYCASFTIVFQFKRRIRRSKCISLWFNSNDPFLHLMPQTKSIVSSILYQKTKTKNAIIFFRYCYYCRRAGFYYFKLHAQTISCSIIIYIIKHFVDFLFSQF